MFYFNMILTVLLFIIVLVETDDDVKVFIGIVFLANLLITVGLL